VSEKGNIVYLFPSLSATAQLQRGEILPTYLEEKPWVFSAASTEELLPVILLAIVNFFGSLWLFGVHTPLTNQLAPLILALVIYGSLFVAIPLFRLAVITMLNKGIEKRNAERANFAMQLRSPSAKLATKLKEAQGMAKKSKMITGIVYTTERDVLEQEFDKPPHSS
jgi:type VI protein secretion system component VasK